jgi:hypothetical protein
VTIFATKPDPLREVIKQLINADTLHDIKEAQKTLNDWVESESPSLGYCNLMGGPHHEPHLEIRGACRGWHAESAMKGSLGAWRQRAFDAEADRNEWRSLHANLVKALERADVVTAAVRKERDSARDIVKNFKPFQIGTEATSADGITYRITGFDRVGDTVLVKWRETSHHDAERTFGQCDFLNTPHPFYACCKNWHSDD